MKKVLILLLAIAMCSAMLFGCSNSKKDGESTTASADNGETKDPSGENGDEDDIGEYNFGGAEFTILTRSETSYEHVGDIGSNNNVSQAVYSRNEAVSQKFGVNITTVTMPGGYDERKDFVAAIRADNISQDGAYDLISTHSVYLGWFAAEDILVDLSKLPEIDFSKSYWNQNLYDELNIDGSCYIMIGDIGHTLYQYMSVMFANNEILEDNSELIAGGINGIYDMVDKGSWTWEALYNISVDYGKDLPGTYGLLFNTHAMRAAVISQDARLFVRNEDDRFYMPAAAGDHMVKAVENLSKFFGPGKDNMYFAKGWGTEANELNDIFTTGSALFYGQTLDQSEKFSETMSNYSVLPLPKYDSFQTDYYTICRDTVTAVAVMNVAKNHEMSGVITQALAKYGSEIVTPEYYEKALKYSYATDPRCPEMLETIRASLTISSVATYFETGIDYDMFKVIIENGETTGIAGKYGEYVTSGNTLLTKFYSTIDALKAG